MATKKQQEIYNWTKRFILTNGHAPTIEEIGDAAEISSKGTVHRHVQALCQEGLLMQIPNESRNIRLTEIASQQAELPLLGTIAAGRPIEAISVDETLNLTELLLGPQRYALRVSGESMIDEGILDGDIVVCERCQKARDGEIVVALIDSYEATLKRFRNNGDGTITLIPANETLKPLVYQARQVAIQGKLVGLLRLGN